MLPGQRDAEQSVLEKASPDRTRPREAHGQLGKARAPRRPASVLRQQGHRPDVLDDACGGRKSQGVERKEIVAMRQHDEEHHAPWAGENSVPPRNKGCQGRTGRISLPKYMPFRRCIVRMVAPEPWWIYVTLKSSGAPQPREGSTIVLLLAFFMIAIVAVILKK